jgi:hypothetical protein
MALRKHWPELLDSLRTNILPKYQPRWSRFKNAEGGMWLFESWDHLRGEDEERLELLKALQDWAAQWRITEDWIIQTALDTLQGYSAYPNTPMSPARPKGSDSAWFWMYAPRGPDPAFQPQLDYSKLRGNVWYPQEDWKIFKTRQLAHFAAQLEDYRREVERRFGARGNLTRDAEWTARYQKGETAIDIAFDMKRYRDSEQAVYRAVERFALTIGLNLRKTHRQRRLKP